MSDMSILVNMTSVNSMPCKQVYGFSHVYFTPSQHTGNMCTSGKIMKSLNSESRLFTYQLFVFIKTIDKVNTEISIGYYQGSISHRSLVLL